MVSIILTSFREPKTIGKAVTAFLNQTNSEIIKEIIIVAPDIETLNAAKLSGGKSRKIKIIKDPGKGKPTALNLAISKTKSTLLVLSDGDVYVDKDAVNNLIKSFGKNIGAVSGRVIQLNEENGIFGYWAKISAEAMHDLRKKKIDFCTGYLYAIRKKYYAKIPSEILADDAYISKNIIKMGQKILYNPKAIVYVRYPGNLIDWIRQKKRTAGKFYQLSKYFNINKERELISEVKSGLSSIRLIKSPKHIFYLSFLGLMRSYIWVRVFFDFRLKRRKFEKVWLRPISTKK